MSSVLRISNALREYIKASWSFLRRSPLDPSPDPKVKEGRVSFLYIPDCEDKKHIEAAIISRQAALLGNGYGCPPDVDIPIEVRYLPDRNEDIQPDQHGLLYLPNDYVVPGGRFNEMYGWDSYWIVNGLIDAGYRDLAKGMVENFFYEINNYGGKVLNANRTYYLSRSQPPLLSLMVDEVANFMKGEERIDFLKQAVSALEKDCDFWQSQRFVASTGLFRYGHPDMGKLGLCPEVVAGEVDKQTKLNHYEKIISFLKEQDGDSDYKSRFYDPKANSLTVEAIAGDRGVRESGFDPSMYMGFFGLETLDINPVCLNSLLYAQFDRLSVFYEELGNDEKKTEYRNKAQELAGNIQEKMWNEEKGLYFCFNSRTGEKTGFKFLTTFYPMFAGIATKEQAQSIRDNLGLFETEHGLMTTSEQTGCQWDAPNMWAPLVSFAVQGLLNYGFRKDAYRIGAKFLKAVQRVYDQEGVIYEKYNARTGGYQTDDVTVGYKENVIGFGWTNSVVVRVNAMMLALDASFANKNTKEGTAVPIRNVSCALFKRSCNP